MTEKQNNADIFEIVNINNKYKIDNSMHNILGKEEPVPGFHYKIHDEIILKEIKELVIEVTIGGYYATLMRDFIYECKNILKLDKIYYINTTADKKVLESISHIKCKELFVRQSENTINFNSLSNTIDSIKIACKKSINVDYITNSIKNVTISCKTYVLKDIINLPHLIGFHEERNSKIDKKYDIKNMRIKLPLTLKNLSMSYPYVNSKMTIINKKVILNNLYMTNNIQIKSDNVKISNIFADSYKTIANNIKAKTLHIKSNNTQCICYKNHETNISVKNRPANYFSVISELLLMNKLKIINIECHLKEMNVEHYDHKILGKSFLCHIGMLKNRIKTNKLKLKIMLDHNNLMKMDTTQLLNLVKDHNKYECNKSKNINLCKKDIKFCK